MSPLRMALVGVGAHVFTMHAPALRSARVQVVGVADVDLAAAERRAEEWGCPSFGDHRAMLSAIHPDAVAVLAPHPFHASIAIDCLAAGAHVLVEKPIAVDVAEADRMIDAAREHGRLLAVNLQHRTRAEVRTAHKIVQSGRLGTLQRVEMVAIWTRTARYYAQAGWRGTWRGEGGGVLMNQSPHSLDLVCHLAGQPSRVVAWNRTMYHAIETEDTSIALLEWPDGALGSLLVSTAQAGEPERLEIAGTRGILSLTRGGLQLFEAEIDLRDFLDNDPDPFGNPTLTPGDVDLEAGGGDHTAIYANFLDAVQHGAPLVADGAQGRLSLELANALIYSSHTGQQVSLPLDRPAYTALLQSLRDRVALTESPTPSLITPTPPSITKS
jgi:predicted dehydrogenase